MCSFERLGNVPWIAMFEVLTAVFSKDLVPPSMLNIAGTFTDIFGISQDYRTVASHSNPRCRF